MTNLFLSPSLLGRKGTKSARVKEFFDKKGSHSRFVKTLHVMSLPQTGGCRGCVKSVKSTPDSLNSCKFALHLDQLNAELKTESDKERAKKLAKIGSKLKKEQSNLVKYEEQEIILGNRNSYAQTDTDAKMLRSKRGELVAAYNVQHTTSGQYIVNYTIAQNGSDNPTLIPHLDKGEERFAGITRSELIDLCADAGYGSEENYAYMEQGGINAYVKYPLWHQEKTGELEKLEFRRENWPFDKDLDEYTCPDGRKLSFLETRTVTSEQGYEKEIRLYQGDCSNCPMVAARKRGESNRTVSHSPQGEEYKAKAKERLETDRGKEMRSKRAIEAETPFGDIKYNMQYDRFILRGIDKVYIENGLLAIRHNLRKVYCAESGIWAAYYAQRAAKKGIKTKKRV